MLLTDIRDYLQIKGRASLQELARHFNVQETAMQQMLTFWITKQKVKLNRQPLAQTQSCSDCSSCNDSTHQIYSWCD